MKISEFYSVKKIYCIVGDLLFSINAIISFLLSCRLKVSKPDWRWQLQPSGRFAHNKDYVKSVGNNNGLQTVHYEAMDGFRREGQKDVRGHIFIMRKAISDEL